MQVFPALQFLYFFVIDLISVYKADGDHLDFLLYFRLLLQGVDQIIDKTGIEKSAATIVVEGIGLINIKG